jgi:hypothetical protein
VFIDRPCWKLPISENPIPIREGMHLRAGWQRFYRVLRVNFRAEMVELQPMFDCQTLTLIHDPEVIEVSFEDVARDYRPTMLGDGVQATKPLSRWDRIRSGKLFQDP